MKKILRFPDGSAFESTAVVGITWEPSRGSGEHRSRACLRVYGRKQAFMSLGRDSVVEQLHYIPMDSDEEAREACNGLTRAWGGYPLVEMPTAVGS